MTRHAARSRTIAAAAIVAGVTGIGSPRSALAQVPNANYRLAFADEFNGASLDTSKWSAASPGWTMPNSASTASPGMVNVGNGALTLSATRNGSANTFTSGSVSSYQKFNYTGGYCEARILLPNTVGSWPAFWGLYNGWPPEADIMEYPLTSNGGSSGLNNNQYNTNFHYTNGSGAAAAGAGVVTRGSDLRGSYHIFGMDWNAGSSVAFYLDGAQVQSFNNSAVAQMAYMYMILDYAVGGWPGTPTLAQWPASFTDQMKIDWVRVWQTNSNGDASSAWNVNGDGAFGTAADWATGNVPARGNTTAVFGRVGTAATSNISMNAWQLFGGITFDGNASGTTAYTLGSSSNQIQLASTTGSVTVQATAASTANQTVNAGVELWSNTTVRNDMTGGQVLTLGGGVTGNGQLTVEGVGPVVLSHAGNYTGGTVINLASQGAAVLRATATSALGTGSVIIGSQGNSTTARLEIANNATLPNNIDFRGRNNNSVGIQNISGNNVIGGTVTANVGGGTYLIQSDAGNLTLSGTAGAATVRGVAIQAASGARNITLQGNGGGVVSGAIRDGGGTVSITKAGPGTWTLSAANSYTGATTINGGTLRLSNPTIVAQATPIASYNFSQVSGTTVINGGSGGAALNGVLNANGGTGSISTSAGPAAGMGALILNGNGTTVDVNSGVTDLSSSANWTVSAWIKTTQAGATILNKGDGTNWTSGFSTFYLGNGNSTGIGGLPDAVRWGGGWLAGATPVNDGNWHLVTYTDASGTKKIYVDGVADALTQSDFLNTDTGSKIRIGFSPSGETDGNLVPSGSLSGINIYNVPLSAAQIAAMYSGVFASSGSPLPSTTNVTIAAGATLDVNGVTQTIASLSGPAGSAVTLGNGRLTVASPASSQFDGNISGAGGALTKSGSASLTLTGNNSYTGVTTVTAGTLVLKGGGAQSPVLDAGGADIKAGKLLLDYTGGSDLSENVRTILGSSYASNFASGQIHTSNTQDFRKGIGFLDNTEASQLALMYTYYGDTNLDGQVNTADFTALAASFNTSGMWQQGDFNFDGIINALDFNAIAGNFGAAPITAPPLGTFVPEPSVFWLALAFASIVSRRKRSSVADSGCLLRKLW